MSNDNVVSTDHYVQFYRDDAALIELLSDYVANGLRRGHGGIVIATKAHRDGLAERLQASGLDLAGAQKRGQYVPLDAAETLARFMRGRYPDERRFIEGVGGLFASTGSWYPHVRAFGEMVALLWTEGNGEGALRLERLWNNIRQIHCFSLLCAYPKSAFEGDDDRVDEICKAHARVIPMGSCID